jgi:hypothetical protein
MEPYAPPGSEPQTMGLDLGQVVMDALSAVARNLLPLLGAGLLVIFTYFLSIVTCVGWIFLLPVLLWGVYRFTVQMVDGRASVSVFWDDLPPFGEMFLRMWGVMLLMLVIMAPILVVGVASSLLAEQIGLIARTALTFVATTLYSLVLVRVQLAPLLVVDRRMRVFEAFGEAWQATGPRWGPLVVLQLLVALLGAPAQVVTVGMQMLQEQSGTDPQAALEVLPAILGLYLALIVLSAVAGVVGMALYGVVYRRLFPKVPANA